LNANVNGCKIPFVQATHKRKVKMLFRLDAKNECWVKHVLYKTIPVLKSVYGFLYPPDIKNISVRHYLTNWRIRSSKRFV